MPTSFYDCVEISGNTGKGGTSIAFLLMRGPSQADIALFYCFLGMFNLGQEVSSGPVDGNEVLHGKACLSGLGPQR